MVACFVQAMQHPASGLRSSAHTLLSTLSSQAYAALTHSQQRWVWDCPAAALQSSLEAAAAVRAAAVKALGALAGIQPLLRLVGECSAGAATRKSHSVLLSPRHKGERLSKCCFWTCTVLEELGRWAY